MKGSVGIREVLMALYGFVWAFCVVVFVIRTGQWPGMDMWGVLGLGEGALLTLFAGEAAARRRGNGNSNGNGNGNHGNGGPK